MSANISASGYDLTPLTEQEKQKKSTHLTDEEKRVLLHQGTEAPFCGGLLDNKEDGVYLCKLCELPLFRSASKFDSGTGWPSFHSPFDPDHIRELHDHSLGMARVEIRCARCDSHLGHVFPDGPPPSGQRYCLNSISMTFGID